MKYFILPVILLATIRYCQGGPLKIKKRAAFYIANETACVVDSTVYSNGDPIPTDDPCESCKCRPPGFACVLKECEVKPGCRAVRRVGHCCPEYICGCEHNGRMYRDGDEIHDSQNPCYTCHCQGSSIACAFVDCFFRVDCAPEYVQGECCPHYTHCASVALNASSERDGSPFAFEKDPTPSNPLIPESTTQGLFQQTSSKAPYEENSEEEVKISDNDEPYESVTTKPENTELHFIYNRITEAPEIIRDIENVLNFQTTTIQSVQDEKSSEDGDSNESKNPEEEIIPTENISELISVDSDVVNNEAKNEKPEGFQAQSSSESNVNSDESVPSEATDSKENFEIFAADEENGAEATTVSVEVQTDTKKIIEPSATTKKEYEIETNNIEKRFRSLSNITSEDVDSENTESKEKLEDGKSEAIAVTELVTPKVQEDISQSEENNGAVTPTPEANSSDEDSSEETNIKQNQETDVKESQETVVEKSQEKDVEESQETDGKESQETDVKESPKTDVEEIQETEIKEADSKENTEITNESKITENLYYNAEEKASTFPPTETVTSIIDIKAETSLSADNDATASPSSNTVEINLFRALDEIIHSPETTITIIQKDLPTSQKQENQELSTESSDYTSTSNSVSLKDKLETTEIQKYTDTDQEKTETASAENQTTESEITSTVVTDAVD